MEYLNVCIDFIIIIIIIIIILFFSVTIVRILNRSLKVMVQGPDFMAHPLHIHRENI
jgi:hypothetical protein